MVTICECVYFSLSHTHCTLGWCYVTTGRLRIYKENFTEDAEKTFSNARISQLEGLASERPVWTQGTNGEKSTQKEERRACLQHRHQPQTASPICFTAHTHTETTKCGASYTKLSPDQKPDLENRVHLFMWKWISSSSRILCQWNTSLTIQDLVLFYKLRLV